MRKRDLIRLGFEECDFGFVIELSRSVSYCVNHEEARQLRSIKELLLLVTRKAISEGIHVGMARKAEQVAKALRVGLKSTIERNEL